jgi:hypothetical protein
MIFVINLYVVYSQHYILLSGKIRLKPQLIEYFWHIQLKLQKTVMKYFLSALYTELKCAILLCDVIPDGKSE